MTKQRIIAPLLAVLLIAYLVLAVFFRSSVSSYLTEEFKEKALWQANYVASLLTGDLSANPTQEELKRKGEELSQRLGQQVEIIWAEPKAEEEELRQAFAGRTGSRIINGSEGKTMLVALPLPQNMVLRVSSSMSQLEVQEEKLGFGIALVAVALFLMTYFLLGKLLAQQTVPLEKISSFIRSYLSGKENERLPINANGVYGVLAYGFNTLADNYSDKKIELQREEHKNKLILDNMDNAMAIIAGDGSLVECNKPFTQVFQATAEEPGTSYAQLLAGGVLKDFHRQCLRAQDGRDQIIKLTLEGQKKVFKVFGAPLLSTFQNQPTGVLMVFHDITALQDIYDKQTIFVSNASHELSTPLTTIRGFAETLQEDDTGGDKELRHNFLNIIVEESKRMQALIKDLLQLAKLDQAEYRQSIILETFALKPIFKEIEAEFSSQAEQRQLQLRVEHQELLDSILIYAKRDWCKQILVNLLENALKYTPQKGSIVLSYTVEKDCVACAVTNSGEGLTVEESKKIFDRFYRPDKSRTRAQGGSGLGLSIVKFMVELLGGTITVDSRPMQGVTFKFTLPRFKG